MNDIFSGPIPTNRELKQEATRALAGRRGRMAGAAGIYMGLTLMANLVVQGTAPQGQELLATLLILALNLLMSVLSFGYYGMCLDCARGEKELPLSTLLVGTGMFWRVIGVTLQRSLLVLFQTLPAILISTLAITFLSGLGMLGAVIASLVMAWTLWLMMKVWAAFSMAEFILWDKPELKASECLRLSQQMMRGKEVRLLTLAFSFLLWILLAALLMGLPLLWLSPWMLVSAGIFYRHIGGDKLSDMEIRRETVSGDGTRGEPRDSGGKTEDSGNSEKMQQNEDLKAAFTTSAYRDREDK